MAAIAIRLVGPRDQRGKSCDKAVFSCDMAVRKKKGSSPKEREDTDDYFDLSVLRLLLSLFELLIG